MRSRPLSTIYVLLGGGLLALCALFAAAEQSAPPLPPGVRLDKSPDLGTVGADYEGQLLVIDWTHPLLRLALVQGLPPGEALPLSWDRATRDDPEGLFIQLVEPCAVNDRWSLALPMIGPVAERQVPPARGGVPQITINGLCPWLPGGPPLEAEPERVTVLSQVGSRFGVRWLGRIEDLDAMTSATFAGRCLVSWLDPRSGQGRFALLRRRSGGRGELDRLRPWLKTASRPGEWLAVHSFGEDAIIGAGPWRLGGPGNPRRIERAGLLLHLSAARPGELVDWARLPGCAVEASSFEPGFPPQNMIRGLFWPNPFAPAAWISRPTAETDETAWAQLRLENTRPVSRVILVWADVAGWSEDFRPGRIRLLASGENDGSWELLKEFDRPTAEISIWQAPRPLTLRRLRLEFPVPSAEPLQPRVRQCGFQVWGPLE